jgi:secreted trypsin-like serine protease
MLCAGRRGGAAPCNGDSGGPLLVRDPASQAVHQIGVVSYGQDCEAPKTENVFANVASGPLAAFIDEVTPVFQNSTPRELATGKGLPDPGFLPLVAAHWIAAAQAVYRWHAKAPRVVCARNSMRAVTCRVHYRARGRYWYFRLRISDSHGDVSLRYLR